MSRRIHGFNVASTALAPSNRRTCSRKNRLNCAGASGVRREPREVIGIEIEIRGEGGEGCYSLVAQRPYSPSSPALQSLISRPHSDLSTCEAVIRLDGLGSKME